MLNTTKFQNKKHLIKVVNKKDNYWLWLSFGVLAMVIASSGNLITG